MQSTQKALRVLHTSDWHIGKRLYHQNRYEEFMAFLVWLYDTLCEHEVDVLIVAGDVFDTMTPSNLAQSLYYEFLAKVASSPCQHVIIIGGNHDSPTLLDAPKTLLKNLNIHIIGVISPVITEDCLVLYDDDDTPQAIVMAVPYLRDKDIKTSTHLADDESTTLAGIARHYETLTHHAKEIQRTILAQTGKKIPLIATGHLFCAGASVSAKDDGMRDIHVGTLGQIPVSIFDEDIDYVALGHIHAPQKVGGQDRIRYCGSPLALGFGEVGKQKQVLLIDFAETLHIQSMSVPTFQLMCHVQGDLTQIFAKLDELINTHQSVWVQIIYTGDTLEPQLTQKIRTHLEHTSVLALHIQNKTLYQNSLHSPEHTGLENLDAMTVFAHRLAKEVLSDDEERALTQAYQTVLDDLHDEDRYAN